MLDWILWHLFESRWYGRDDYRRALHCNLGAIHSIDFTPQQQLSMDEPQRLALAQLLLPILSNLTQVFLKLGANKRGLDYRMDAMHGRLYQQPSHELCRYHTGSGYFKYFPLFTLVRKRGDFSNAVKAASLGMRHVLWLLDVETTCPAQADMIEAPPTKGSQHGQTQQYTTEASFKEKGKSISSEENQHKQINLESQGIGL